MANKLYKEASIQKIANTIRTGNQSDETYKVSEMPFAISEIDTTAYGKIPSYWEGAVENAIETIEGMRNSDVNNIPLFAWFSDMHKYPNVTTSQNAGNTGILSATVMNRCGIPFAMFCGDAMASGGNGFTSESQVIDNFIDVNQMLSPIGWHRLLQTQGNHDGSWGTVDGTTYAYQSTQEKINKWVYRKMTTTDNHIFGGDGSYYYADDTENKIRIIMLNSLWSGSTVDYPNTKEYSRQHYWGYGQTQLDWLCSTALNVGDDWLIIIGTHIPPTSSYKSNTREYNIIRGILTAYEDRTSYSGSYTKNTSRGEGDWANVSVNVNFSSAKGKIIGFFAGHCHKDQIITDDLPFPIVTITADANIPYDSTEEKRVFGTDNEHAIDFVTVNRVEESVTLTRLGVGSSRAYSYRGLETYYIANSFTNVSSNNGVTSIIEGSSYSATLTANGDCDNLSVTVLMGGVDITSSVVTMNGTTGCVISISEVTGNVTVTATAKKASTNVWGLYKLNARLNTSEDDPADNGAYISAFIPITQEQMSGDIVLRSNKDLWNYAGTNYNSSGDYFRMYSSATAGTSAKICSDVMTKISVFTKGYEASTDTYSLTVNSDFFRLQKSQITHFRFCCKVSTTALTEDWFDGCVLTINEEITEGSGGSGSQTPVYSIVNNLTNVTSNNTATSITEGSAYSATLTAESGYELSSVVVTMGGTDITSTTYSNGVVNIASVTGNIVIAAIATLPESEFVNKMVVQESNINKRISGTAPTADGGSGLFVCDPIAVNLTQSCPVIMKNFASTMGALESSGANYANAKVALLNASKTYLAVWYIARNDAQNTHWKCVVDGADMVGDLQTIFNNTPTAGTKPNPADVAYVVFSPQISTSAITASDLTGMEIQLLE